MQSALGVAMAKYQEHLHAKIGIQVEVSAVYTEATFKRIVEDAIFFRRAAENINTESEKKRYARLIILLMSLYLESLSNRIFLHLFDQAILDETKQMNVCLDHVDCRNDLPGPIRNFRAIYTKCLNKELNLDTRGIQDIFTIRNRIIAHPSGRVQLHAKKDGWMPAITSVKWREKEVQISRQPLNYAKFKHFPPVYSYFTLRETDEILEEVRRFLADFLALLGGKVAQKQLDEWWPAELIEWSKSVSPH
jgi:hypothetical protein